MIGAVIVFQDITNRKKMEEELRSNWERLELALEGSNLGLWDSNLLTGDMFYNQQWIKILGYGPGEIKPHRSIWEKMIHPEDLPDVEKALKHHIEGHAANYEFEYRIKAKSGEWKWILDRGKVFERDESNIPIRIAGTMRDVTDQRQKTLALIRSEEMFRTLVTHVPYGFVVIHEYSQRILYYNPIITDYFGLEQDPIDIKKFSDLLVHVHPDDRIECIKSYKERMSQKKTIQSLLFRIQESDGTIRWIESHGNRMKYFGEPAIHIVFVDRTYSEAIEDLVKLNQDSNVQMLSFSLLGQIIIQDPSPLCVYANPQACEIFEYSLDEMMNMPPDEFSALIHEEDQQLFQENCQLQIREKKDFSRYDLRIKTKQGHIKWVAVYTNLIKYCGKPSLQMVFLVINDWVASEKKRSLNHEIYWKAFQQMNQAIAVCELIYNEHHEAIDYQFVSINPEFTELFSVEEEWIVHKKASELFQALPIPHLSDFSKLVTSKNSIRYVEYNTLFHKNLEVYAYSIEPPLFATIYLDISLTKKIIKTFSHINNLTRLKTKIIPDNLNELSLDTFLNDCCKTLVTSHAYHHVCILLLNDFQKYEAFYNYGFSFPFDDIKQQLEAGWLPECVRRALKQNEIFVYYDIPNLCSGCPVHKDNHQHGRMVVRLEHQEKNIGVMIVTINDSILQEQEVHDALNDVAVEISRSIYKIQTRPSNLPPENIHASFCELFSHLKSHTAEGVLESNYLKPIIDLLYTKLQLSIVFIETYDPVSKTMNKEGERNRLDKPLINPVTPLHLSLAEPIIRSGKELLMSSLQKGHIPHHPWVHELKLSTLYCLPLTQHGTVFGCITLGETQPTILEPYRSMFQTFVDFLAHRVSETRLKYQIVEKENLVNLCFHHSSDGFLISDEMGNILDSNKSVQEEIQFKSGELAQMHLSELIVYNKYLTAQEFLESKATRFRIGYALKPEDMNRFDTVMIHTKQGDLKPFQLKVFLIQPNPTCPQYLCLLKPEVKASLRKDTDRTSPHWFHHLAALTDVACIVYNDLGKIIYANAMVEPLFNIPSASLIKRYYHSPDLPGLGLENTIYKKDFHPFSQVLTTKQGLTDYPMQYTQPQGNTILLTVNAVPTFNATHELEDVIVFYKEQKESEYLFRDLIEGIHDVVFILSENGSIQYVSPSIQKIMDYPIEEIVGKNYGSFSHPDDLERMHKNFQQILHGKSQPALYRVLNKSGDSKWVRTYSIPIYQQGRLRGIYGVLTNITDQIKAEMRIEHREDQFYQMVEVIPTGFWSINPDWTENHYISPAFEKIFGIVSDEFYIHPPLWMELIHADDRERVYNDYTNIQNVEHEIEYRIVHHASRQIRWVRSIFSPVRDIHGNIISITGILEDITERKLAEKQIKDSLKEKEVLLKEIHHRVKNNLQIIYSLLSLQSSFMNDHQSINAFIDSQNRVKSMALIHEKLYQSDDLASIDFEAYVKNLAQYLLTSYRVDSNAIHLNIHIDQVYLNLNTAIPCALIINELISNSLKHAFKGIDKGEIWISLHLEKEEVKGGIKKDVKEEKKEWYHLIIMDSGKGMPDDFDITKSSSLGLQLVNTLIEQLEGSIHVKTDHGTSFDLRIPKQDPPS